jgi:hypothetical protein
MRSTWMDAFVFHKASFLSHCFHLKLLAKQQGLQVQDRLLNSWRADSYHTSPAGLGLEFQSFPHCQCLCSRFDNQRELSSNSVKRVKIIPWLNYRVLLLPSLGWTRRWSGRITHRNGMLYKTSEWFSFMVIHFGWNKQKAISKNSQMA